MSCAAFIVSVWLSWMLSLVFLYVFNFGILVFMSCVNYIIEKKRERRACRSDATTFDQNKQIFYMLMPRTWLKVEEFRLEFSSHVGLLNGWLISYINMYHCFAEPYVKPFSLQLVLAGVFLFKGVWRWYIWHF